MTRLPPLLLVAASLACHHTKSTTPPDTTGAAPSTAAGSSGTAGIDAELVTIAAKPGVAIKFKLRVDGSGAVVKQSLYHSDAASIPAEVLAKAEARWPGAAIVRYETERYADHGRVHEVEVTTAEGARCELAIKADGTELYEECQIAADAMPAPVAAKITALYPQGKVLEAETKRGPGLDELTVEIESGGQEFYVRIQPDGTVLAKLVRVPGVFEVPID